jgi:hypothetical protein
LLRATPARAAPPVQDPPATTPGDTSYAGELIARAHALHLADEVEWRRLGHYHRGPNGEVRGEADGRLFWLAPDGKVDPSAELDATIEGIWAAEPTDPRIQHPFCRFPARLMWLDEKLHLDAARLPRRECRRYAEYVGKLRPSSVAVVFSAYYLNSPASAFGHTFLRVHRTYGSTSNELLDTGVDYAAVVDTTNALLYAFKGLTGLFPGMFHSMPFFYKVREYNDYESRDLWEYELDLSPKALAMLVAHLWEEGSTYFDYFYLSENCSYHVLAAIEVSDPRLHLLDKLRNPVVPVDTVRALMKNPGLVRGIRYRPSLRTTLRTEIAKLDPEQTRALASLVDDAEAPLPDAMTPARRAQVLEAASDLLDTLNPKELLKSEDPRVARAKQRLLERRAAIPIASEPTVVPPPYDKMPHAGHSTSRLVVGTGYSPDLGGDFYEVRHRLALHDLADPPDGYPDTSQIEFLPFRLRYYLKQRSLEVDDFSILKVASLQPWARFQHPMSWTVNAGATRVRDDGCPDCFAYVADLAAGITLGEDRGLSVFALADVGVQADARMNGLKGSSWRPGLGPVAGARWRLSRALVWTADGRMSWYPLATPAAAWLAETSLRWGLATDVALGVDLRTQPLATEGELSAFLYF